jgi:methionyl-tRNA formyltransferase
LAAAQAALWGPRIALRAEPPDLLIVVAYGLLPRWMLDWPAPAINLRVAMPRWRGAAPIQYAILAGDAATGVSVMQMEAGHSGPVYLARSTRSAARDGRRAARSPGELAAATLTEALP